MRRFGSFFGRSDRDKWIKQPEMPCRWGRQVANVRPGTEWRDRTLIFTVDFKMFLAKKGNCVRPTNAACRAKKITKASQRSTLDRTRPRYGRVRRALLPPAAGCAGIALEGKVHKSQGSRTRAPSEEGDGSRIESVRSEADLRDRRPGIADLRRGGAGGAGGSARGNGRPSSNRWGGSARRREDLWRDGSSRRR